MEDNSTPERKYLKSLMQGSIEDILRIRNNSDSNTYRKLITGKIGEKLSKSDMKLASQYEKAYFKSNMHEKLNLDGYIIFQN